jgi:hypothetical protein
LEEIAIEIAELLRKNSWKILPEASMGYFLTATYRGPVFDFLIDLEGQGEGARFNYHVFHQMQFRGALYSQLHYYTNDLLALLNEMSRQKGLLHKENYAEMMAKFYDLECDVIFEDAEGDFFPMRIVDLPDLPEGY